MRTTERPDESLSTDTLRVISFGYFGKSWQFRNCTLLCTKRCKQKVLIRRDQDVDQMGGCCADAARQKRKPRSEGLADAGCNHGCGDALQLRRRNEGAGTARATRDTPDPRDSATADARYPHKLRLKPQFAKMRNLNVPKRSVMIAGHRTSVSLETAFWDCLKEIATDRGTTVAELIAAIDQNRSQSNLSSAIRLFVLEYFQNKAATVSAGQTRRKSEDTPPVR